MGTVRCDSRVTLKLRIRGNDSSASHSRFAVTKTYIALAQRLGFHKKILKIVFLHFYRPAMSKGQKFFVAAIRRIALFTVPVW